jgi:amino acid adenylation domain-containing protein
MGKIKMFKAETLPFDSSNENSLASATDAPTGFQLSDMQYAYLIGRSPGLELGGVPSSCYMEYEYNGLDVAKFVSSLHSIVAQHPMLRASVSDGGRQVINPYRIMLNIHNNNFSSNTVDEANTAAHAVRTQMKLQKKSRGNLTALDAAITVLPHQIVRVHFWFDLMFVDLRSVHIVLRDLWAKYGNIDIAPVESLPTFSSYLDVERKAFDAAQGQRDKNYWLSRLENFYGPPELPFKKSPDQLGTPVTGRITRILDEKTLAALNTAAEREGLTAETLLLGCFAEVLRHWSKRQHFTITTTQLARHAHFPNIDEVVGNFLFPLLVPVLGERCDSLRTRFQAIQSDVLQGREHSIFNGVHVLRELTRRNPDNRGIAAPIVFSNLLNADLSEAIGCHEGPGVLIYTANQTPQVWLECQVARVGTHVHLNWNFVEELFHAPMLENIVDAFGALLEKCAFDPAFFDATGTIVPLPKCDATEREAANATARDIGPELLHKAILRAAAARPNAVAVVQGGVKTTFQELVGNAAKVANHLREEVVVSPGDLIAVSLEPGAHLLSAVLGVLIAGGAYVAIDPTLPLLRRESLLRRCNARAVVTDVRTAQLNSEIPALTRLCIDSHETQAFSSEVIETDVDLTDLAYVIFTSGSTGEPKGVMIAHESAHNTVTDINKRFSVGPDDTVFSVAPAGFDLSVYDYFGVLGAGGKVAFQEANTSNDPQVWAEELLLNDVTIWNSVPAPVKALVDRAADKLASTKLRLILMSGDWIPIDLPQKLKDVLPKASVISLGGATEGSIWSICYPIETVDPNWKSVPYGKPLTNQQFHVFNDWLAPSPKWVTGELYISGVGLAQGYLADPAKTHERFLIHPDSGERIYRTGDLGRYIENGNLEILGREDNQVKINGYRVELGEVEACLVATTLVQHVVIDAPTHAKTGQRQLVAYYVPVLTEDTAPSLDETLRKACKVGLPSYMVPTYFISITDMPLTSNGKIDRKALPSPWTKIDGEHAVEAMAITDTEQLLLDIWKLQLKHSQFQVNDGFFDVGGDSLHAVGILSAVREKFDLAGHGDQEMIEGLFMNVSVQAFAKIIDAVRMGRGAQ